MPQKLLNLNNHTKKRMKTITIKSRDKRVITMAQAVKIRNEFVKKGFKTRQQFVAVVCQILPEFAPYDKTNRLVAWWNFRGVDDALNFQLETVLNQLKAE